MNYIHNTTSANTTFKEPIFLDFELLSEPILKYNIF